MRVRPLVPVAAALLSPLLASPTRADAPPHLTVPFEKYRLPNGLTVILHEDHRLPTVAVDIWYGVGSKDEVAGKSGFAHLFEHLMFMGTRAVPNGKFDAIMEAAGGSNNATTSEDRTNYFESGPSNLLATFLWLEADRLATLADDMTREKLDLQRDVVKNERRQSYENRPYGKVELVLPEHLFPASHPYHHPVIGSHEDLTAASVEDVTRFFRTWYSAANATLVVDGDFRPAEAKQEIARYFGGLPVMGVPSRMMAPTAELAKSDRVALTDAVELAKVVRAWHSPAAYHEGDAECDLLAGVLGGGKSSRLWRALVYERKIASAVEVEQRSLDDAGMFVVSVMAQPGHAGPEIERALDEELAKIAQTPVAAAELERARALIETQQMRPLEKPVGMADALASMQVHLGDPGRLGEMLVERYGRVTAAMVTARAQSMLGRPSVTVVVEPEAQGKEGAR